MPGKNNCIEQFLQLKDTMKEMVLNYDYESALRGIETETKSVVTQGIDYAQRKASSVAKRLLLK